MRFSPLQEDNVLLIKINPQNGLLKLYSSKRVNDDISARQNGLTIAKCFFAGRDLDHWEEQAVNFPKKPEFTEFV